MRAKQVKTMSAGDLQRFSDTVHELYRCPSLLTLPHRIVELVSPLFRSSSTHYAELNPVKRRLVTVVDRVPDDFPELTPVFETLMHEHPVIRHHRTTGDGTAHRLTDFLTEPEFHNLPLYNEAYRPAEFEHEMSITLPAPQPLLIGVVVHRSKDDVDFDERDRLMFNLLRPHLVQAYENASRADAVADEQSSVLNAMEALDQGVAVLRRDLSVRTWTRRAWVAATRHFRNDAPAKSALPETLSSWAKSQLHPDHDGPSVLTPFVCESEGARLTVRLIPDVAGRQYLLTFDEHFTQPCANQHKLSSLNLTERESEVLCWVVAGETNAQIAAHLSLSPRTIQKHLERIFTKLGVETRTAAAAIASRLISM